MVGNEEEEVWQCRKRLRYWDSHPSPVVVLAVHEDAGDIGRGQASVKEEPARLWLTRGPRNR